MQQIVKMIKKSKYFYMFYSMFSEIIYNFALSFSWY